jgi:hypothetical protein
MKKAILLTTIVCASLLAIASFTSTTYIDPYKTFILGEGKHTGYSAKVSNAGSDAIEVYTTPLDGKRTLTTVLKPSIGQTFKISSDVKVEFVNNNASKATLNIVIKGAGSSDLSMGYN